VNDLKKNVQVLEKELKVVHDNAQKEMEEYKREAERLRN